MKTVIFVCTSNTCRSPMAEGFARRYITSKLGGPEGNSASEDNWLKERGWQLHSAGLTDRYEPEGSPASAHGLTVMHDLYCIDTSSHRSTILTNSMIEDAFAIYTVSENHRTCICQQVPSAERKTRALGNVLDPWRQSIERYEETARRLKMLVEKAIEQDWELLMAN